MNRAVVSREGDEMHLLVEGYGLLDVMGITGMHSISHHFNDRCGWYQVQNKSHFGNAQDSRD